MKGWAAPWPGGSWREAAGVGGGGAWPWAGGSGAQAAKASSPAGPSQKQERHYLAGKGVCVGMSMPNT